MCLYLYSYKHGDFPKFLACFNALLVEILHSNESSNFYDDLLITSAVGNIQTFTFTDS
jgi:hypothetical protein